MQNQSLKQEVTNLHADVCSALADPTRILILYALSERPHTVNELAAEVGIPQPTASRHLKVLRDRNLVTANRQGMSVEYNLADMRLIEALNLLRGVMRDRISQRATIVAEEIE